MTISIATQSFIIFSMAAIFIIMIAAMLTIMFPIKCPALYYYLNINVMSMLLIMSEVRVRFKSVKNDKIVHIILCIILCEIMSVYIKINESKLQLNCYFAYTYYKISFIIYTIIVASLVLYKFVDMILIIQGWMNMETFVLKYYSIKTKRWYYIPPIIFSVFVITQLIILIINTSAKHAPVLNMSTLIIIFQYFCMTVCLLWSIVMNKCIDMSELLYNKLFLALLNTLNILLLTKKKDLNKVRKLYDTILFLCITHIIIIVIYAVYITSKWLLSTMYYSTSKKYDQFIYKNEQYITEENEQYITEENEQYITEENEQYITEKNEQYITEENEQNTQPKIIKGDYLI